MEHVRNEAWKDFLDMTISQALTWAAQNIAPEDTPSEVVLAEPYIMGSHSGEAGAWVSGPEDVASDDYFWGYNRMTTIRGLFAAGDGVGAAPHKFSSGSFTEGRIAAKAAVNYLNDNPGRPVVSAGQVDGMRQTILAPLSTFEQHRGSLHSRGNQPQLSDSKAGTGPAAEDHGRIRRRYLPRGTPPTVPPCKGASSSSRCCGRTSPTWQLAVRMN